MSHSKRSTGTLSPFPSHHPSRHSMTLHKNHQTLKSTGKDNRSLQSLFIPPIPSFKITNHSKLSLSSIITAYNNPYIPLHIQENTEGNISHIEMATTSHDTTRWSFSCILHLSITIEDTSTRILPPLRYLNLQ